MTTCLLAGLEPDRTCGHGETRQTVKEALKVFSLLQKTLDPPRELNSYSTPVGESPAPMAQAS